MTPDVIRRIIEARPSCVTRKHEDWPGLEKMSKLHAFQAERRLAPLSILTGNGGLFLNFETERGAQDAMTGHAFPELLTDVVRLSTSGQRDAAHGIFDTHVPLIRYEQQLGIGLAVRKHLVTLRGIIVLSAQREPWAVLSATMCSCARFPAGSGSQSRLLFPAPSM